MSRSMSSQRCKGSSVCWAPSISAATLQSSHMTSVHRRLAPRVTARGLAAGLGQPVRAHDLTGEVQLRQRLRAARDVVEDAGHERAPAEGLDPGNHLTQVVHPDQALLNARGEDRHRAAVGRHPGGGVDQRPRDPRPPRLPGRVHVRVVSSRE